MTKHNDPDETLPVTQPAHLRQTGEPVVAVPVETDVEPVQVEPPEQASTTVIVEQPATSGAESSDQPDEQAEGK